MVWTCQEKGSRACAISLVNAPVGTTRNETERKTANMCKRDMKSVGLKEGEDKVED